MSTDTLVVDLLNFPRPRGDFLLKVHNHVPEVESFLLPGVESLLHDVRLVYVVIFKKWLFILILTFNFNLHSVFGRSIRVRLVELADHFFVLFTALFLH